MPSTITQTSLADLPVRRGKVRDIYDLGDTLLLVSTDRISAFDWVLPTRNSGQGPRADAAEPVLVRAFQGCAESFDFVRRRRFRFAGGGRPLAARGPVDAGAEDERRADRVRGARLSLRLGLDRISEERARCVASSCRPGCTESDKLPGAIFTPATKAEQG